MMDTVEPVIEVVDELGMTPALDLEFRGFLIQAFEDGATSFAQTRYWHGSAPSYSVVARLAGHIVAHAGVVVRELRVGGQSVQIYGIQNMGVLPRMRRTGAGLRVLAEVAREAARRGIAFGVLFCIPELEHYYQRDGWKTWNCVVLMDYDGQKNIPIPGKNVCMVKNLTAQCFPSGEIHLQGADW